MRTGCDSREKEISNEDDPRLLDLSPDNILLWHVKDRYQSPGPHGLLDASIQSGTLMIYGAELVQCALNTALKLTVDLKVIDASIYGGRHLFVSSRYQPRTSVSGVLFKASRKRHQARAVQPQHRQGDRW